MAIFQIDDRQCLMELGELALGLWIWDWYESRKTAGPASLYN